MNRDERVGIGSLSWNSDSPCSGLALHFARGAWTKRANCKRKQLRRGVRTVQIPTLRACGLIWPDWCSNAVAVGTSSRSYVAGVRRFSIAGENGFFTEGGVCRGPKGWCDVGAFVVGPWHCTSLISPGIAPGHGATGQTSQERQVCAAVPLKGEFLFSCEDF